MQNLKIISKKINLENGREIIIETGKLAKQADGSVTVRMGNAILLATVVAEKEASPNIDFLPLSVDYREKFSAGGKIPGGFLKREGKLSDKEVLVCRLVDRAIRPMFPKDFHAQVQININLISADPEVKTDALAALAASSAIAVSDIPILDYISEVRVARIDGKFKINPSPQENENADIDLMVAGTLDHVIMVEGNMDEVSEEEMLEAIIFGHKEIIKHCELQKQLAKDANKTEKREYLHAKKDDELANKIFKNASDKIYDVIKKCIKDKKLRHDAINKVKNECLEQIVKDLGEVEADLDFISKYLNIAEKQAARKFMLKEKIRLDGRKPDEIRDIWNEIDILPGAHGSALFTRGETQSLTTVTLGGKLDEQLIDNVLESGSNKFMLHYNFPAFSTGEVRPSRGPGRREIGHGNLAMEALKKVLPLEDENPYTIRIVSDILESNGSSSMATVCAGSMALMDSGIKIRKAVSGIAMGLITDKETDKYTILSDIIGDEDHIGDMDFKITGTEKGITACQMDIKVEGIPKQVLEEALMQAKKGRLHILEAMNKTISSPREDFKPNTPRIESITVDESSIGAIIGPGGKVIQDMQKETNTVITIENINGMGLVKISAPNKEKIDLAKQKIKLILAKPEIGEVYKGKIKAILDFGAFVEFLPGKDGLLHISEVMWDRIDDIKKIYKIGDEIEVKLIDIDKAGRYKLSRKALIPRE